MRKVTLLDDYTESPMSSGYTCIPMYSVGICDLGKLATEEPSPRLLSDLCRPVTE